jgi:hypothetical protein
VSPEVYQPLCYTYPNISNNPSDYDATSNSPRTLLIVSNNPNNSKLLSPLFTSKATPLVRRLSISRVSPQAIYNLNVKKLLRII